MGNRYILSLVYFFFPFICRYITADIGRYCCFYHDLLLLCFVFSLFWEQLIHNKYETAYIAIASIVTVIVFRLNIENLESINTRILFAVSTEISSPFLSYLFFYPYILLHISIFIILQFHPFLFYNVKSHAKGILSGNTDFF